MKDVYCPQCGLRQPRDHAYCLRCGASVPTHLLDDLPPKTARMFAGMRVAEGDVEGAFLRVSFYRKEQVFESEEGSVTVPGHHVRFSVWSDNTARCVISLPEAEAVDLARFLSSQIGAGSFPAAGVEAP
jgi:hypothetical protein